MGPKLPSAGFLGSVVSLRRFIYGSARPTGLSDGTESAIMGHFFASCCKHICTALHHGTDPGAGILMRRRRLSHGTSFYRSAYRARESRANSLPNRGGEHLSTSSDKSTAKAPWEAGFELVATADDEYVPWDTEESERSPAPWDGAAGPAWENGDPFPWETERIDRKMSSVPWDAHDVDEGAAPLPPWQDGGEITEGFQSGWAWDPSDEEASGFIDYDVSRRSQAGYNKWCHEKPCFVLVSSVS